MKGKQEGFTLIELVVVITILGILAAFAFPRFAALAFEARVSSVEALAGSVRSAAALAHSLSLVSGNSASVTMEGRTIDLVNGYPDDTTIDDTLTDITGFNFVPGTALFMRDGAPTPSNCSVDYNVATPGNMPIIVVDIFGC